MNQPTTPTLMVLLGPTGVGKTALSIRIAEQYKTPIISCDSRQLYREMSIGTAVPDKALLQRVPHHFLQSHSISEPFNAARFESEVLDRLDLLFAQHDRVLMTGGSMLYIDAVCKGIDDLPDVDPALRTMLMERLQQEGLERMRAELKLLDPEYYQEVDLANPVRIIHALEICYTTGKSLTSQRTNSSKKRHFNILKIGLNRDRNELYDRINLRVEEMVASGLEEEVRSLLPYRQLNTLNTVGYREFFDHFDQKCSREEAIEKIKANTRKYARKQLTWFRKDPEIHWFHPDQETQIFELIKNYRLKITD